MRIILAGLLIAAPCGQPVRADPQATFCGRTLDGWIAALRDPGSTEYQRGRAVAFLAYFGPQARHAVPDLIAALDDRRLEDSAIEALGRIGPDAAPAVPLLVERLLEEPCELARTGTIFVRTYGNPRFALPRIGGPAVPAVAELLSGPNIPMRPCAAEVLAAIGPDAAPAVPALITALQSGRPVLDFHDAHAQALRRHAIIALGRIGPPATPAIPALNALLAAGESYVEVDDRDAIVEALTEIGAPPVARLLDAFLREGEPSAASDLSLLGP
jgi:hypothetical protein